MRCGAETRRSRPGPRSRKTRSADGGLKASAEERAEASPPGREQGDPVVGNAAVPHQTARCTWRPLFRDASCSGHLRPTAETTTIRRWSMLQDLTASSRSNNTHQLNQEVSPA